MADYLTVAVKCDPPSHSVEIEVPKIELTPAVAHVVWCCVSLPAGGTLEIRFTEPPREGPFIRLERDGNFVIGSGNVGSPKPQKLEYEVRVRAPKLDCSGKGVVVNLTEQRIDAGPIHCSPPDGPPSCET